MDEKLRILKVTEEGTTTAEQGAELIAAMNLNSQAPETGIERASYGKKMFRIIVDNVSGDKVKVQFPVGAIKKVLKATGRLPIPEKDLQSVDLASMMKAIFECLDGELEGDFVNAEAADGSIVKVYADK